MTLIKRLSTFDSKLLVGISVLFSEMLTSLMSIILRGKVTSDYLVTGGFVSLIVSTAAVYFMKQISRLSEDNENLQREIINRKAAEEALQESEEIFRYFMEHSPIFVFFKDENIRALRLSRNFETMLNRPLAELLGKSMDELFPSALAKSMVEDDKRIMSEDKTLNIEEELNGRFYQTIKFPINIKGKPRYLAGYTIDITERKKAEEELRKSEEFIKNILETVDEGFVIIDPEFRIISANKAYCEQVKSPHCDIFGRHCYEVSHHLDRPCFLEGEECAPSHTFKTGLPYTAIHTHYDSEGNSVYIEAKSYPVKDASGKITAVIETLNNISEKRRLEEQLRHGQKMEAIGTLAGGIAHDFNNILNVIIGFGTMVMDGIGDDQLSREHMNEVLAAADRAVNLTKRLLVFSRKEVADFNPMDVNKMVINMEKMLSRIIGEDINLVADLMGTKAMVMADAGQMEQVLMNLAANARDAMPKGGSLTISTGLRKIDNEFIDAYEYGAPTTYTVISITDTGTGIDKEKQNRIFDPFFTTKEVGKGTGLGLSIAYGIIKQHNGYIKVYSETGKGTTFKIWLPVLEETAEKKKEVEALSSLKGGTETILVAEDDAGLRKLSRNVLEAFGYSVITAEDGEDAISKFMENRGQIDLVVLDMIMPKKSGKEAYEEIRKTSPDIKILFVSGYTMDVLNKREILEEGMDYILKPVSRDDILRKVRDVLDR